MKRFNTTLLLITAAFFLASQVTSVCASVVTVGNVDPDDASTWTNTTYANVGYTPENDENNGAGSVTVTDGDAILSNNVKLGYSDDSSGTTTVSGEGSTWNNKELYVGYFGSGTLTITDGGSVASTFTGCIGYALGSSGKVIVDGEGSTWKLDKTISYFYIGRHGSGTLNITNGGAVSNRAGYIGRLSGSSSEVTVDGEGSTWANSSLLFVGLDGNGTLNIVNGGMVSADESYIGGNAGSSSKVTVDGEGSIWINDDDLYIGRNGSGTLNITNGGAVSNDNGYIGFLSDSSCAVTINGEGSSWTNNDNLYIGYKDSGTLDIRNNGLVSIAETLTIDYDENNDSFINMSDGGMLALFGEGSSSLTAFFDLVQGTDAIQWWNPEVGDWETLSSAILGEDYTLEYLTDGELEGYTLLTVYAQASNVPEPSIVVSLLMLFVTGMAIQRLGREKAE